MPSFPGITTSERITSIRSALAISRARAALSHTVASYPASRKARAREASVFASSSIIRTWAFAAGTENHFSSTGAGVPAPVSSVLRCGSFPRESPSSRRHRCYRAQRYARLRWPCSLGRSGSAEQPGADVRDGSPADQSGMSCQRQPRYPPQSFRHDR